MARCEWFALCENEATKLIPHPILPDVPTCDRCAKRVEWGREPVEPVGRDQSPKCRCPECLR
jgi:hypothetical protein